MITTTMSDGTTTHHHSKDEIETVCLKEACAQFTQSSDTPFPASGVQKTQLGKEWCVTGLGELSTSFL